MSTKDFYESGRGDILVDETHYPPGIVNFLRCEEKLLDALGPSFELLVEVGCMYGRHLGWAVANGKSYLGIDVVKRYVDEGRRVVSEKALSPMRHRFICGAAEDLPLIMLAEGVAAMASNCLLFFPFNSFGNMAAPLPILRSIGGTRAPFLISSYLTTAEASACRANYYELCGYNNVRETTGDDGVLFTSEDGLRSIAYHPGYLSRLAVECSLEMKFRQFSTVGIAYSSPGVHTTLSQTGLNLK